MIYGCNEPAKQYWLVNGKFAKGICMAKLTKKVRDDFREVLLEEDLQNAGRILNRFHAILTEMQLESECKSENHVHVSNLRGVLVSIREHFSVIRLNAYCSFDEGEAFSTAMNEVNTALLGQFQKLRQIEKNSHPRKFHQAHLEFAQELSPNYDKLQSALQGLVDALCCDV
jgi:hypothetical protein